MAIQARTAHTVKHLLCAIYSDDIGVNHLEVVALAQWVDKVQAAVEIGGEEGLPIVSVIRHRALVAIAGPARMTGSRENGD